VAVEFETAVVVVETGARADGFRFGDTCAELVVADMLESVLLPRIIAEGFSFFSFFSLTGGGCTGEGVGRGKAMLLLSGRAVTTDVGGLMGRDVPIGAAERATGRAIGMPLPQAAELGSEDPATVSSTDDGFGHDAFWDIGGAVTCTCFCLASYSAGRISLASVQLETTRRRHSKQPRTDLITTLTPTRNRPS